MKKIALSQNFSHLAALLSQEMAGKNIGLQKQFILVPNLILKGQLFIHLASFHPSGGIAGVKICTLEDFFPETLSKLELQYRLYQALPSVADTQVIEFLSKSEKNRFELQGVLGLGDERGVRKGGSKDITGGRGSLCPRDFSRREMSEIKKVS